MSLVFAHLNPLNLRKQGGGGFASIVTAINVSVSLKGVFQEKLKWVKAYVEKYCISICCMRLYKEKIVTNDSYRRTYTSIQIQKIAMVDSDRKKINLIP